MRCSLVVSLLVVVRAASASEGPCAGVIDRDNLVACSLRVSPALRAEQLAGEAAQARKQAASTWLPSNPLISLSAGRRSGEGAPTVTNWYVNVGQEVEIGGQRSARVATADAELRAQQHRSDGARRQIIIDAWTSYFDVLAARDELALQRRLEALSAAVSRAARGASDQGLISGLEADIVEISELRSHQGRLAAEGRWRAAIATLASLLGRDVEGLVVEGELEPLPDVEQSARASRLEEMPALKVLNEERRAQLSRVALYRRLSVPNPTLSLFIQNDGFNEHAYGVGLAFPLPLPAPIGRTFAGERAEAELLAQRALAESERVLREGQREKARALADYEAKVQVRDALSPARLQRAEQSLEAIAEEIQRGRLAIRDAIVAQQTLLELLTAQVTARRDVSVASVALARAAGLDLERGAR